MLKYYSYYSVGGYKDFMLGDSECKEDATFYFPLLSVLEERSQKDKEVGKQVAELKALPAIRQLSAENTYGLPSSANVMFSHAGYKLIYKHLEGDMYALALRDISQDSKDETGRSIPFLFVITGDSNADIRTLDILATYFAGNIKLVEQLLSQLLHMDMDKNGLRFELAKFNKWIKDIVKSYPSTIESSSMVILFVKASKSFIFSPKSDHRILPLFSPSQVRYLDISDNAEIPPGKSTSLLRFSTVGSPMIFLFLSIQEFITPA